MTRYGIDMGDNETFTVITESRNLRSLPFKRSEDQLSTGNAWEDWLEEIERESFDISESPVNWIRRMLSLFMEDSR